jgi:uncharacterized protein
MDVSLPATRVTSPSDVPAAEVPTAEVPTIDIPQYGRAAVLGVWAAATLPMAALSWLVAPALAGSLSGEGALPMAKALLLTMTGGLLWQAVLVAVLVGREQGSLRWTALREALWLRSPRSPRSGRRGGRMWLVVLPLTALFVAGSLTPTLPVPGDRDLGIFLASDAGQSFLHGAWGWFGLMLAMWVLNTVLGEELLFRGFLLPRMNRAFGRIDWLVNGVLFAAYHLHVPWVIPTALLDAFTLAYPSKRYRSAWIGIVVHSSQSVFFALLVLLIVV